MNNWFVSNFTNIPTYHLSVVHVACYVLGPGYPYPFLHRVVYNTIGWVKYDTYYTTFSRIVSVSIIENK